MEKWREVKLGDVINLKRGYDLPQRERVEGNIPIVTSSGITGYHNVAKVKAPGVVTGRYGTLGEIFYIKEDYWPHNTALYVQNFKGNDPLFISYFLRTLHFSGQNVAGAVPGVNRNYLHLLPVRIPPYSTQRRIADILSAYDDLIENNIHRMRILEEMAHAIYQEWIGKVDKASLPKGWDIGIIRDFCESYNYGYTAKAQKGQDGIKYLRITDIVPEYIDWDDVPSCEIDEDDVDKYLLKEGDIVAARTGATTGYAKQLGKKHPKAIFASYLVRFRIQPEISSYLIGLIVESDEYKKFIQANLGGAAQPMANAQVLTSFPLVIPPKELQKKFDFQAQPLFEQKEVLQMKNANLRQTRDLLLPRLVSGEVEVHPVHE